jgi:hypothetical protein
MTVVSPPSTTRRLGVAVIVGVILAGAAFAVFSLMNFSIPFPSLITGEEYQEVGPTVIESVQALSELTSVEMVEYTTIEKGEDYGWLNFVSGDRLFLFAVSRVGAGVDLAELDEQSLIIDDETSTVVVRLPAPEIFYSYLDSEATQVIDRDTGLLTRGDIELESEARREAERLLTAQAIESGILEEARSNAEMTISEFLHGLGYQNVIVERSVSP